MGFFDALGTVLDRVAPTALAFVAGGPAAALQTAAAVEKAKRNEKNIGETGNESIRTSKQKHENTRF